jgi:hypothetical protein
MAGAGFVIIFVVAFAGCAIWTMIYLTVAAHYFLTTIVESSAGIDEVEFTGDVGVIEWWWKPFLCLWVLGTWIVPISVLLLPVLAHSPQAYAICWTGLLWLIFPVSLMSALYTQSWFFLLHPVMLWRMLRHFLALAYVHLMTLGAFAACVALVVLAMTHSFLWAGLAAFAIPTAILFYARHWGRFAWLSLNFLPRKKKTTSPYMEQPMPEPRTLEEEDAPQRQVQEVHPAEEGVRAGLPAAYPGAIQASNPVSSTSVTADPAPAPAPQPYDEWSVDNAPYVIEGDATQPSLQESMSPPPAPAAGQTNPAPVVEEEEDEWSLDKKPYGIIDDGPPVETALSVAKASAADEPMPVSQYYDQRARKEEKAKRKAKEKAEQMGLPKQSKKTPTFQNALLEGVWPFMIYGRTLRVWTNLVVLTMVELFFLMMVVRFWPKVD